MNIETEITPNPETLKFKVNKELTSSGGIQFNSIKDAGANKFTDELFGISGIKSFFIGKDFISITKQEEITWGSVKPKILTFLIEFFNTNEINFDKSIHDNKNKDNKLKTKDKISEKIKDIIDKQVRPAVAQDGGDIIFENFENGIVYLTLRGACVGCPSSTATLKQGIENLLKHHFPQVKEVHAVN